MLLAQIPLVITSNVKSAHPLCPFYSLQSLRWVPASATRDQAYEHLNARVPDDVKYALHVLMVEHGKRCAGCAKGAHIKRRLSAGGDACPIQQFKAATSGDRIGEREAKKQKHKRGRS